MKPRDVVDYATPATAVRRRARFSIATFLVVGIPLAFVYAILLFVIPRFEAFYRDFGNELPSATRFVIGVAHWGMRGGWLAILSIPLTAGLIVPLLIPHDSANPRAARSRLLVILLLINALTILALIASLLALLAPIYGTITQTIGGK